MIREEAYFTTLMATRLPETLKEKAFFCSYIYFENNRNIFRNNVFWQKKKNGKAKGLCLSFLQKIIFSFSRDQMQKMCFVVKAKELF